MKAAFTEPFQPIFKLNRYTCFTVIERGPPAPIEAKR